MLRLVVSSLLLTCSIGIQIAKVSANQGAETIRFDRDVIPILAEHCFQCHGPDESTRVSDIQINQLADFVEESPNETTLLNPGRPTQSELWLRIDSQDHEFRMPPSAESNGLSDDERRIMRRWIEQGAALGEHWAYVPPVRPPIPEVTNNTWPQSPIDFFILRKLESQNLSPSESAPSHTLLRRASLDVTGLPPTPDEIKRFLNNDHPTSWERLVDRLLDSPRFGERMAQGWLDAARYADTTGHAADKPRTMWLYREGLIEALNANQPFDQFTIEQLAGDLLENPSEAQLIATGFHRNSMQALGNNPRKEEFRIKGIVDRVDTTGRVWMGLSVGCAECHDHKYDRLTQQQYYELFAIFNNVPHYGERFAIHGPRIEVLSPLAKAKLPVLRAELAEFEASIGGELAQETSQSERIETLTDCIEAPHRIAAKQSVLLRLEANDSVTGLVDGGSVQPISPLPMSSHDSHQQSDRLPTRAQVIEFTPERSLLFHSDQIPQLLSDFSIGMWVRTEQEVVDLVSRYDWKSGQRSYVFGIGGQSDPGSKPGMLSAWISSQADPFDGVVAYGSIPVNDGQWHHVALSFEAGESLRFFVDGQLDLEVDIEGAIPPQVAESKLPLAIGAGFNGSATSPGFRLDGMIADLRIVPRALNGRQLGGIHDSDFTLIERLIRSETTTIPEDLLELSNDLEESFNVEPPRVRAIRLEISKLESQRVEAQVMDELEERRETFVHIRGDFENPGQRVFPTIPIFGSHRSESSLEPDRLGFARDLVSIDNPLTARVTVNRIWQHYFGVGLVATADDFGVRGSYPSHAELLDWLAVEFIESDWDVKHIHRLILTSATYRQTSDRSIRLQSIDPENRLLARAPRIRLDAEQIRDLALAASGVLVGQIGGPSVFPPQPATVGQFRDATAGSWMNDPGAGQYRRSIYTFVQRMSPYPSMILFDAPTRERCTVDRPKTNTPLQALVTLNDPHFVDLAKRFGRRIELSGDNNLERIEFAFLASVSRYPDATEAEVFSRFVQIQHGNDPWFQLAQVLLNTDESLVRE